MDQINKIVGKNIRRFRTEKKISQTEAARAIELNQGHLSEVEAGKRSVSVKQLWKASRFFKKDLKKFFNEQH